LILKKSAYLLLLSAFSLTLLLPNPADAGPRSPSGKNFSGENPLGVSRAEFAATQEGMDLIYQRRYNEALEQFEGMGFDFPDSPVGPIGRALVHQAAMFENYDFSRDRAYQTEVAEFRALLAPAQRSSRTPEWISFLNAVYLGVDAMYDVRRKRYVRAFDKGWDALEEMKRVQRGAPDFPDVQLALGVYNYWRTVLTESIKVLPRFGDRRAEGLEQLRAARDAGLLAAVPASFALTFSLIEKGETKAAIAEAQSTGARYPDSVLNQMILAQAYTKAKRFDESLSLLQSVLQRTPEIQRAWFAIAEVHYKSKTANDAARVAYKTYLRSDPVPPYKAYSFYRLGQLEARARNYEAAIDLYERALEIEPKFGRAKKRLEAAREALSKAKGKRGQRDRTQVRSRTTG
jgi:tetratricopeptide (TPR) repeat protein